MPSSEKNLAKRKKKKGWNPNLITSLDPNTNLRKYRGARETCPTIPWRCYQQNPECGKLLKTNNFGSSTNKEEEKRQRGNLQIIRDFRDILTNLNALILTGRVK